jgi:hypothetical protein
MSESECFLERRMAEAINIVFAKVNIENDRIRGAQNVFGKRGPRKKQEVSVGTRLTNA